MAGGAGIPGDGISMVTSPLPSVGEGGISAGDVGAGETGVSITVVSVRVAGPSEVTGASVVNGVSEVVVSSSELLSPHAVSIEPTASAAANT
ncbi:hypothetical protein A5761_12860 [Mycolicibacterium setense]|uniref:Uncharacterized protein n=1 Tax=Mycolicibacterium setense TaxID=431269 RepID=A0ABR4YUS5_9MYCO|nr:hypothetical protein [Mycolicibacterium setense]KHO25964.1 hypothetical protein QQ44_09165 [Mycolicibacterium setense]OBB15895.1 hypothetical protein A5761_12860 [Mycolicibacterium setense]